MTNIKGGVAILCVPPLHQRIELEIPPRNLNSRKKRETAIMIRNDVDTKKPGKTVAHFSKEIGDQATNKFEMRSNT